MGGTLIGAEVGSCYTSGDADEDARMLYGCLHRLSIVVAVVLASVALSTKIFMRQ